jgi:hypothetical protein
MIYARNQITVPNGGPGLFRSDATFTMPEGEPAIKLTCRTYDNDVVVEVTETFPPVFTGDVDAEMELAKGFESLVFATPITAFRFRCAAGTARVTFRAYG